MDRGAWWATVHGGAKSDRTEELTLSLSVIYITGPSVPHMWVCTPKSLWYWPTSINTNQVRYTTLDAIWKLEHPEHWESPRVLFSKEKFWRQHYLLLTPAPLLSLKTDSFCRPMDASLWCQEEEVQVVLKMFKSFPTRTLTNAAGWNKGREGKSPGFGLQREGFESLSRTSPSYHLPPLSDWSFVLSPPPSLSLSLSPTHTLGK